MTIKNSDIIFSTINCPFNIGSILLDTVSLTAWIIFTTVTVAMTVAGTEESLTINMKEKKTK